MEDPPANSMKVPPANSMKDPPANSMEDPPANSMKDPSEGDQSNDQAVQLSADEEKRKRKLATGKKYRVNKQLKREATKTESETMKNKAAELEKYIAYTKGRLVEVLENLKETRQKTRHLLLQLGGQTCKLYMAQEQFTGDHREPPVLHVDDNLLDNTSIGDQINDQIIEPSADQGRKTKKQLSDEKYRNKKKQKKKAIETELEESKAKNLALEKRSSYYEGRLDESKKQLKEGTETNWQLLQQLARQANELQQLTGNSGRLPDLAQENQVLQTGNNGGLPDLAQENQVLQTGNSGGLPVIPHDEPFLNVDDLLNDDYGEMPVMKQQ